MGLAICTCARSASCQSSPGACGQLGPLGAEPCVWCRQSIAALVPSEGCLEQAGGPVVQMLAFRIHRPGARPWFWPQLFRLPDLSCMAGL